MRWRALDNDCIIAFDPDLRKLGLEASLICARGTLRSEFIPEVRIDKKRAEVSPFVLDTIDEDNDTAVGCGGGTGAAGGATAGLARISLETEGTAFAGVLACDTVGIVVDGDLFVWEVPMLLDGDAALDTKIFDAASETTFGFGARAGGLEAAIFLRSRTCAGVVVVILAGVVALFAPTPIVLVRDDTISLGTCWFDGASIDRSGCIKHGSQVQHPSASTRNRSPFNGIWQ